MAQNTSIFASDKSFDIGCPVIKWNDQNGFSFYNGATKKYNGRNITFDVLKNQINSLTFHHSVTYSAKQTYTTLITRGLSVNFIIDDNVDENGYATIYQCADIKDACWSQAPLNNCSVGCEISYMPVPTTAYTADLVSRYNVTNHQLIHDNIHGKDMNVYGPSDAQVKSCTRLAWGICELFGIPGLFPKDNNGKTIRTVVDAPADYKGLLFHMNITRNKIDPAGFPDDILEKDLNSLLTLGF